MHQGRAQRDFEKHIFSQWFGNHALLLALTSTPGEMTKLTGRRSKKLIEGDTTAQGK